MRGRHRWAGLALVVVLIGGCTGPRVDREGPDGTARPDEIVVGAFNFSESRVVAELYVQTLSDAGLPVGQVRPLGTREMVEPALEQGFVDIVPEYAGSALNFLERRSDAADADPTHTWTRLREASAPHGLTVGRPAPAQNQNAVAVQPETAAELGLRTVGDLRPVAPELTFGGPPECPRRPTCLQGLEEVYGLRFERFLPLDRTEHVVAALRGGEIDVGLLFTTDPALAGFVALEDDAGLQPAENLLPILRDEVLVQHGEAVLAALDELSGELTTAELAELNRQVGAGAPIPEVAEQWLAAQGLTQ